MTDDPSSPTPAQRTPQQRTPRQRTPRQRTPRHPPADPPKDVRAVSPLVTGLDRGKLTSRGGPVPLKIARFMMGNSHGSASVDRALADLATLEHNSSKISSTLDGKDATTSMLNGKDIITPNLPAVSKVGQEINSSDKDKNAMEVSFVENNDRSQSPTATFAELEQQGDETDFCRT